jgi:hypothetical protein
LRFEVNACPPENRNAESNSPADNKKAKYQNAQSSSQNDETGNLYKGTKGISKETLNSFTGQTSATGGITREGKDITMNTMIYNDAQGFEVKENAGDKPSLVSHEILHTMGLPDDPPGKPSGGRMEYAGTKSNNFQMKPISNDDIKNILNYAKQNSDAQGSGCAKATVSGNATEDLKNANKIEVSDKKEEPK